MLSIEEKVRRDYRLLSYFNATSDERQARQKLDTLKHSESNDSAIIKKANLELNDAKKVAAKEGKRYAAIIGKIYAFHRAEYERDDAKNWYNDAKYWYYKAESECDDAKNERGAKNELKKAKSKLDHAQVMLENAQEMLEKAKLEFSDAQVKLSNAETEFAAAEKQEDEEENEEETSFVVTNPAHLKTLKNAIRLVVNTMTFKAFPKKLEQFTIVKGSFVVTLIVTTIYLLEEVCLSVCDIVMFLGVPPMILLVYTSHLNWLVERKKNNARDEYWTWMCFCFYEFMCGSFCLYVFYRSFFTKKKDE